MFNYQKVIYFIKPYLASPINLGISSFSFWLFLKYCEGHDYEPYTQEIKRPLSDSLQMCIENQFDYDFINPLSLEEVVTFMSETTQFENAGLQDLCLTKLALMIRSKVYILYNYRFKIR